VAFTETVGGPRAREDLHDQPVGTLLKQLATEITTLVRLELDLAKAETRQTARQAAPGVAMIAGAVLVALLALGALTAFLILALDGAVPNWLAALIVTGVYASIAALLYTLGKQRIDEAGSPAPRQTIETLKEDVEWAKHPTTFAKR
jgi:uncharacterized membrane protein YqjE